MQTKFINPNKVSKIKILVANFLGMRFIFDSSVGFFIVIAGDILRLQHYLQNNFNSIKRFSKRELLWNKIVEDIQRDATIYEFGVAHGYTTNYLLENIRFPVKYFGFDLFTGLPNSWRNLKQGTFSNGGTPPNIIDQRLRWVVGDIHKTYNEELNTPKDSQNIFFFDLDLYEPTLHAYSVSKKKKLFKAGSILYFDEAYDPSELHIIQQHLVKDYEVTIIGCTWGAVAFKITKIKTA